jgi:UDP-galactopyranose mutase
VVHAANYEDWIVRRFGAGVARHFMLPYNRKLWACDLSHMSVDWVGERVAQSGADREGQRRALESDSAVGYPANGGFGEIFRAMARHAGPIAFGQAVTEIDPARRTARTAAGDVWPWRRLVSTMPLPQLLRVVRSCPSELLAAADRLEFVSLKILMILVGRRIGDQPHRVYIADPEIPPHKVAFNHASSPSLRAAPVHAITCEIAYSPQKPLKPEPALENASIDWLVAAGLISGAGDVVETRFVDVRYGYPIPTPERAEIISRTRAWLGGHGIFSIGRFGGWNYANSDACILEGARLAAALRAAVLDKD